MANEIFPLLVGNDRLKERLGADIVSGSLSHAYIIDGSDGSGRHTLALSVAAALSCHGRGSHSRLPCGVCPSCKKILEGKSPDVIYVNRGERATLGVESIRGIRSDVSIAPNDTEYKIYIIEDAETMTAQAQNAFLLTLEEPPAYVLFLLLCDGTENLLETVKSRAPVLRMERVSDGEIRKRISSENAFSELSPDEQSAVILMSEGRIGAALDMLDKKKRVPIMKRREAAREFISACAARDGAIAQRAVSALGSKRDELLVSTEQISLALRDLLLIKRSDRAPLLFYTDREEAVHVADGFNSVRLMEMLECTAEVKDMISRNANARLVAMKLALCAFGERI